MSLTAKRLETTVGSPEAVAADAGAAAFFRQAPGLAVGPLTEKPAERLAGSRLLCLDGLRFFAALCVMIAHGYWYVVLLQQDDIKRGWLDQVLMTGANLGMTLFFVLSGFVIHFNYHRIVPNWPGGVGKFFIARFARLYPLFLVVFLLDFFRLLWEQGYFSGLVLKTYDPFAALPLHLSFTQTWWWWPMGHTTAADYYGTPTTGITGLTWSLSTEAFFYVSYVALAPVVARLSKRGALILGGVAAGYGLLFYLGAFTHAADLQQWAAEAFPGSSVGQFMHWVLFQSPWGRISEFLLGVAAAQAFLVSGRPTSMGLGQSDTAARLTTYGSFGAFTLSVVGVYVLFPDLGAIGTQCCASALALFIYAVARYRTRISTFISRPLLVKLGDASYSLYLLHFYILHEFARAFVLKHPAVPRVVIYLAGMIIALGVARLSYRFFEKPALIWIRANFRQLRFEVYLPVIFGLITAFSLLLSIHMRAIAHADPIHPDGLISVSSASFGDNCNEALHDNVLGIVQRACGNQPSCAFTYDVRKLGDPASGCAKRFQVLYACGPSAPQKEFLIPSFERVTMPVQLSCN